MKFLIINGPNLNMLEYRDSKLYGEQKWDWLEAKLAKKFAQDDIQIVQSNSEGIIIDYIQQVIVNQYDGLIINPGAYAHYSYAIHDALEMVEVPTVEVHLSQVKKREHFRQNLINKDVVTKIISGEQMNGYILAIEFLRSCKK